MFVTLEQFFNDFRIQNGQFPNETVLNRGLMRLKREIRELKSLVDCLLGNPIEPWNEGKIYEIDEFVSYNGVIYRSVLDSNIAMNPETSDFWEQQDIESIKERNRIFKTVEFTSDGMTRKYETPFEMIATPVVFVSGALLSEEKYTWTSGYIELKNPAIKDENITIISGIAYETVLVQPKQIFTVEEEQWHFELPFTLASPAVFVNGLYQTEGFIYGSNYVDFDKPLPLGTQVCVVNGVQGGISLYSREEIDELFRQYYTREETFSKSEVESSLLNTRNEILADPSLAKSVETYTKSEVDTMLNSIDVSDQVEAGLNGKADKATTLAGYNITDAYDMGTVDIKLQGKLSKTEFNAQTILDKIRNSEGENTGLNADTLKGIRPEQLVRRDIPDRVTGQLGINGTGTKVEVPANGDVKFLRSIDDNNEISFKFLNELNSAGSVVIIEGDFKGTWWDSIYNFGIAEPELYNWVVEVHPNFAGNQFDFVPATWGDGLLYVAWRESGQASTFHYGFIDDNVVKLYSWVKFANGKFQQAPSRYVLRGYRKTISTKFNRNQGDAGIKPLSFVWDPIAQSMVDKEIEIPVIETPLPAKDNALKLLTEVTHEEDNTTNLIQTQPSEQHTLQWFGAAFIGMEDYWIRIKGGIAGQTFVLKIENGAIINDVSAFDELGEALICIRGTDPLIEPPTLTLESERCFTLEIKPNLQAESDTQNKT